jgi:hypothetical protein
MQEMRTVTMRAARLLAAGVAALALVLVASIDPASAAGSPTCSETLGIAVHGQHIIGDYITGIGHDTLTWPPSGQVGEVVGGSGGPVVRGGPGPGFHFPNGFPPGASFCLSQAQSGHAVD